MFFLEFWGVCSSAFWELRTYMCPTGLLRVKVGGLSTPLTNIRPSLLCAITEQALVQIVMLVAADWRILQVETEVMGCRQPLRDIFRGVFLHISSMLLLSVAQLRMLVYRGYGFPGWTLNISGGCVRLPELHLFNVSNSYW